MTAIGTRRQVMAALACAPLAGAAVASIPGGTPSSQPDAALIALAAEYCRLNAEYARTCWAEDDLTNRPNRAAALAEFQAICKQQSQVADAIIEAVPVTVAGFRAKARAVSAFYDGVYEDHGEDGDAIMWSMVCDLLHGEA